MSSPLRILAVIFPVMAIGLAVGLFFSIDTNPGSSQTNTAQSELCVSAPQLPAPDNRIIQVATIDELNSALATAQPDTTITIEPGRYQLTQTLAITTDNITVRGLSNNCSDIELVGAGMDNPDRGGVDNGFWINARNTTIANLTIGEVFYHTIQINNKAQAPHIYNVRMYNSGQQFVKANPVEYAVGVNRGIVEYSVMEYTDGTPVVERDNSGTGYTNGVDIHAGIGWRISHNRFSHFHTPDAADHLWNAAVLVWNGARDTITENNVFIDVDRAVAYGLTERGYDHIGGIIRNNMIVMSPDLYSSNRRDGSDGTIVVIDSPETKVLHNTILTNGNTRFSVELRFDTASSEVSNNLADAPISHRDRHYFVESDNITNAKANWFTDPKTGNLRLRPNSTHGRDKVSLHSNAPRDIDNQARPTGRKVDIGADEFIATDP